MGIRNFIVAAAFGTFALSANATVISGTNLQSGLDNITDGSFFDVNTSQHTPDEAWSLQASGTSVSRLAFEFAGFASTNTFGIYDLSNTANRLQIYDGAATNGATGVIQISAGNTYTNLLNASSAVFGSGSTYGYYIDSSAGAGGGIFFSRESDNSDVADAAHDGTSDHMVAYRGDGALQIDITGGSNYLTFGVDEYILAFEDLMFPASDYDYSDMVVLVESVEAVPEPGVLALLGLGLLGLGATRRRKLSA